MKNRETAPSLSGRTSLMNVATATPTGAARHSAKAELTSVPTRNGKAPYRSRAGFGSQVLDVRNENPNARIDGHAPYASTPRNSAIRTGAAHPAAPSTPKNRRSPALVRRPRRAGARAAATACAS